MTLKFNRRHQRGCTFCALWLTRNGVEEEEVDRVVRSAFSIPVFFRGQTATLSSLPFCFLGQFRPPTFLKAQTVDVRNGDSSLLQPKGSSRARRWQAVGSVYSFFPRDDTLSPAIKMKIALLLALICLAVVSPVWGQAGISCSSSSFPSQWCLELI